MNAEIYASLFFALICALSLGGFSSRRIDPDRIRIAVPFCIGTLLVARVFTLHESLPPSFASSVRWVGLFTLSALVARDLLVPNTRPYAALAGFATLTGALIGIGSALWALIGCAVYCSASRLLESDARRDKISAGIRSALARSRLAMSRDPLSDGWPRTSLIAFYSSCIAVFLGSLVIALLGLDEAVSSQIRSATASLVPEMRVATHLADMKVAIPLCALSALALSRRRRRYSLFPALAMVACCMGDSTTLFLKHVFGRPRPYLLGGPGIHAISLDHFHWFWWGSGGDYLGFPSGHSTVFFSIAWVFAQLPNCKGWVRWSIVASAAFLSIGRVTLDQHCIADVAASAAIGIMAAQLLIDLLIGRLPLYEKRSA